MLTLRSATTCAGLLIALLALVGAPGPFAGLASAQEIIQPPPATISDFILNVHHQFTNQLDGKGGKENHLGGKNNNTARWFLKYTNASGQSWGDFHITVTANKPLSSLTAGIRSAVVTSGFNAENHPPGFDMTISPEPPAIGKSATFLVTHEDNALCLPPGATVEIEVNIGCFGHGCKYHLDVLATPCPT